MPGPEQIANSVTTTTPDSGGVDPALFAPGPIASGLACLADLTKQSMQFAISVAIVLALAGTLCAGLVMAASEFTRTSRSTRKAVQSSRSIQALTQQLRSVSRNPETARRRQKFQQDLAEINKKRNPQLPASDTRPVQP
jgi:hypothetical protein